MVSSSEMGSVQRDLGQILACMDGLDTRHKEMASRMDQLDAKVDHQGEKTDEVRSSVGKLDQSIQSLSKVTNGIALEKCGARLDKLEETCKDIPKIMFWHRFIGTGAGAASRIGLAMIGSGMVGSYVVKLISEHIH